MRPAPPSLILICCGLCLFGPVLEAQDAFDILPGWRVYPDPSNALIYHLNARAIGRLDARAERVVELRTPADWEAYQQHIREVMHGLVGPFPDKTPLNARILRTVDKPTYRMEHLVFESQPGFVVTATLFLPDAASPAEPRPAILYCSGHSALAYRSDTYQHVILNLVAKGFIVLAFDPIGQGERVQYPEPSTGRSAIGGPTKEHSYPGVQLYLTGSDITRYMVWDGIRAVDYLLTRPEVDPDRLGITGRSGGGTQTAHIAAFEERLHAAAPENFITNTKRLLQTRGPQDAEQWFRGQVASGIDHPDLLLVRAPKPTLVLTTTNDMFSIQGSRETEAEVARAYAALGEESHFQLVEDLAGHASTRANREAMYAFFQRHLDHPGSAEDVAVDLPSPEDLRVTPTGQALSSMDSETLFSLNLPRVNRLADKLRAARRNDPRHLEKVREAARELAGWAPPGQNGAVIYTGRIGRPDYTIDQFLGQGEGDYPIPFLLLQPKSSNGQAVLLLDDRGKQVVHTDSVFVEELLHRGYTVLVPDLIGTGEMGPVNLRGDSMFDGVSFNAWFLAMHMDRSPVGIRAGDVVRLVDFLNEQQLEHVSAVARGGMASELLHAAALDDRIERIGLVEPLLSFFLVAENKRYDPRLVPHLVPGALAAYDLPDLAALVAPRPLFVGYLDAGPFLPPLAETDEAWLRAIYQERGAGPQLTITAGSLEAMQRALLAAWEE